jgi:hypothetical protein
MTHSETHRPSPLSPPLPAVSHLEEAVDLLALAGIVHVAATLDRGGTQAALCYTPCTRDMCPCERQIRVDVGRRSHAGED